MSRHIAAIGAAIASARHSSSRRQRVGQEHTAWNDPETPGELLEAMLYGNDEEPRALSNPNMPARVLELWAEKRPDLVEQNPALDLMELEDPAMFARVRARLRRGWLESVFGRLLPDPERRALAYRFAMRVAPLWMDFETTDYQHPFEKYLKLPEMVRAFNAGEYAPTKRNPRAMAWHELKELADSARNYIYPSEADEGAVNALYAMAIAAYGGTATEKKRSYVYYTSAMASSSVGEASDARLWRETPRRPSDERRALGTAAKNKEIEWQVEQVRRVYYAYQNEAETLARLNATAKKIAENIKAATEAAKKTTATKAQIAKATKQAKESAQKIADVMASKSAQSWPKWVGLGAVVATGVVVLCIGPEALAAAGVAGAAETILGIAEAADIATVSVSGLEGFELAELTLKFRAAGVAVTTAAVEVVTR